MRFTHAAKPFRLCVESLELRRLLTAYVVDTTTDDAADLAGTVDGQISLREAIIAAATNAAFGDAAAGAAAGDSITFAGALNGQTITLANGELSITDDLTISGSVTVSGNDASRVFDINTNQAVTLTGLTLIKGRTDTTGGALQVRGGGSVTLDAISVTDSVSTGALATQGGGGIYLQSGVLTLSNSTISGNAASGAAGSGGGILMADGRLVVNDSTLAANTANRAGGALEVIEGKVGFQRSTLGGDTAIEGNIAGPVGTASPGNGGAIHVTGGADVDVIGGLVGYNVAALEGGGLWNSATGLMRVLGGAVVANNTASGASADDGGGGIFNNGGTMLIEFSTVRDNKATGAAGSGGGLFSTDGEISVVRSTFSGNSAVRAGGGIELITGDLDLNFVTLEKNTTGSAPGNGGGLHVTGAADVLVFKNRISANTASSEGGGLWNSATGTMRVQGTLLEDNIASGDAADNGGGALFNNGGTLTVDYSTFDDNKADGDAGSGGAVFSVAGNVSVNGSVMRRNIANRAGGAIETMDGTFNFSRGQLLDNVAGPDGTAAPGNGGGVHTSGDTDFGFSRSTALRNVAAREGGALWNSGTGNMDIFGSSIGFNIAKGAAADDGGGGVFNNGGDVYLGYSSVYGNKATGAAGSGGAVFTTAGTVKINFTGVANNVANRAGGGVEIIDGDLIITSSTLSRNVAGPSGSASPGNGGAVHVTGAAADVGVIKTALRNNIAAREGGGLWNQAGSDMLVMGSVLTDNFAYGANADDGGGGIFNNGGALTVDYSQLLRNRAEGANGAGGGLHLAAGGTATFSNSFIGRGSAAGNGGGIYNDALLSLGGSVRFNFAAATGGGVFTDAGATTDSFGTVSNNTPNNFAGTGNVT